MNIRQLSNEEYDKAIALSLDVFTKCGTTDFDTNGLETFNGEVTKHEFVNELFEPYEQVNEEQANLLGIAFELATGGLPQAHIGTGGGRSSSELP